MENKEIEAALIASGITQELRDTAAVMIASGRLVIIGGE